MRTLRFLRKLLRSDSIRRKTVYREAEQEAYFSMAREMAVRIGSNDKPVLAGPYLWNAGSELLYWIPFLRWLLKWGNIERSRMWVMSRDRVDDWYGDIGGRYVELNELFDSNGLSSDSRSPAAKNRRPMSGRDHIGRFDLEVVEKLMAEQGFDDVELIHPSHLFQVLQPYTNGVSSVQYINGIMEFAPIRVGNEKLPAFDLPDDFIVAAVGSNENLPFLEQNQEIVAELIGHLATVTDVVLLDGEAEAGGLRSFYVETSPRIHKPDALGGAPLDLGSRSAILSRARMLVGAYGELSYLGALLGIDSIGLYSDAGFDMQSLGLAQKLFVGGEFGHFSLMHVETAGSLFSAAGQQRANRGKGR